MNEDTRPLMVTIRCITYNHEPYIRQCLEGFVMQETNFRFEAIVHDDASTDGTAAIVREFAEKYPDIIKPIFETENQYSKHDGSLRRIMDEHTHGKYVAFCEGDDYWTDSLKLQKQVDYMERHPQYLMCYGKCRYYYEKNDMLSKYTYGGDSVTFEQLLCGNTIPTLTVLYKKEIESRYQEEIIPCSKHWKMGDYPRWLYIAHKGKIGFMQDEFGVYRILQNSASHCLDEKKSEDFIRGTFEIAKFYAEYFKVPHLYDENYLLKALFSSAIQFGNRNKAKYLYRKIKKPSIKMRIKYFIIQSNLLYNSLKNKLFYTQL